MPFAETLTQMDNFNRQCVEIQHIPLNFNNPIR